MNHQMLKWICVAAVTTALTTAATNAQQEVAIETKVITLENVDAMTVVSAVKELSIDDLYTVASAARVNKVIVQGSRSAVKVVESVIAALDARPEGGGERGAPKTAFVTVRSYPLAAMHRLIAKSLALDRYTKIAADEVNGRIVVTGPDKDIAAVRSLVTQLDKPRSTYTIEFFFIRSGGDGEGTPLPKAMAPIASSLQQSGFGSLSLLAPMIVRVDDGGEFEQTARHSIRHDDQPAELIKLLVSGDVRSSEAGDTLRIELQAQMIGISLENGYSGPILEISTELSIPQGRYVVLAAAPASTRDSDAIALVVHVTSGSFD